MTITTNQPAQQSVVVTSLIQEYSGAVHCCYRLSSLPPRERSISPLTHDRFLCLGEDEICEFEGNIAQRRSLSKLYL